MLNGKKPTDTTLTSSDREVLYGISTFKATFSPLIFPYGTQQDTLTSKQLSVSISR